MQVNSIRMNEFENESSRHFGVSPNLKPRPIEMLGHLIEPQEDIECNYCNYVYYQCSFSLKIPLYRHQCPGIV